MDAHLGYEKNSPESKDTSNRRNGYGEKKIQGSFGEATGICEEYVKLFV